MSEAGSEQEFRSSLERARNGSARAIAELLAPHLRAIKKWSWSLTTGGGNGGKPRPSDVASESVANAIAGISTFQGRTRRTFGGWLRRIVATTAYQFDRNPRPDRGAAPIVDELRAAGSDVVANVLRAERDRRLLAIANEAPDELAKEVAIQRLVHLNGNFCDVAVALGIDQQAARNAWMRFCRHKGEEAERIALDDEE